MKNRASKLIAICMLCGCSNAFGQQPVPTFIAETFGPFGPQALSYSIPVGAVFAAPDGRADCAGTSVDAPTTLPTAVRDAKTGTVIVLRGGTYRVGDMRFNKQITIQPYLNEKPMIKGSKIAAAWSPCEAGWVTPWADLINLEVPAWHRKNFGAKSYWRGDAVFVDGRMLTPVDALVELGPGLFYCDYEAGRVYIADDPTGRTVEIIAEHSGLIREHDADADAKGPVLKGLAMMHFARVALQIMGEVPRTPVEPRTLPNAPTHTRIENCRFISCGREAIHMTSPNSILANNEISDNAYVGMMIHTSHDTVVEHNIISGNNAWRNRGYGAGIKIFNQSSGFTVRNNLVQNNAGVGVWYDVGHRDGIVYNNYLRDNTSGVCVEISSHITVVNNLFKNHHRGIWLHNAADCQVYNNTFINSRLDLERNDRGDGNDRFGWHASTGPGPNHYHGHKVANNVFAGNPPGGKYIRYVDKNTLDHQFQTELLTSSLFLNESSHLFEVAYNASNAPVTLHDTLDGFRKDYGRFERDSAWLKIASEELFRGLSDGDYRLKDMNDVPKGYAIPQSIAPTSGWQPTSGIGAFAQPATSACLN